MNFNLVEMYNGLLRFNKHILNELAEGFKHLPNLDGVSKGDSLIINEQGNPAWGSTAFIPTFENAAYGIEWTKDDNDIIRIGNAKFHRELPIQNRLKGCVYNEKKILSILELILLEMVKLIMLIVEIKLYFILYIDLIIFLLILKLLNMIGVFMLKIEKKMSNLKHNIL